MYNPCRRLARQKSKQRTEIHPTKLNNLVKLTFLHIDVQQNEGPIYNLLMTLFFRTIVF